MKQDFNTRLFWEEVVRHGPMGLTRLDWSAVEHKLDATTREVLGRFLHNLEDQSMWIAAQHSAMREEAERIALIGATMKRAGLRSYTDKGGCIFVAATEKESEGHDPR